MEQIKLIMIGEKVKTPDGSRIRADLEISQDDVSIIRMIITAMTVDERFALLIRTAARAYHGGITPEIIEVS